MRKTSFFLLLSLLLSCFVGCGRGSVLDYQEQGATYEIRYAGASGEISCTLNLDAGGSNRDFTLAFLQSEHTPAYILGRSEGVFWAESCGKRVSVSPPPICLDILALFCIPREARVLDVCKQGETRVVTLAAEETIYTLHFVGDRDFPIYISAENNRFFAVFVN
jgi:hypothetical protein